MHPGYLEGHQFWHFFEPILQNGQSSKVISGSFLSASETIFVECLLIRFASAYDIIAVAHIELNKCFSPRLLLFPLQDDHLSHISSIFYLFLWNSLFEVEVIMRVSKASCFCECKLHQGLKTLKTCIQDPWLSHTESLKAKQFFSIPALAFKQPGGQVQTSNILTKAEMR